MSVPTEALRKIVERTARMGLCSQTHHEHLMHEARGALDDTPQPPAHKPGDPHLYRIECEVCGQRGTVRLSVEPQASPEEEPRPSRPSPVAPSDY